MVGSRRSRRCSSVAIRRKLLLAAITPLVIALAACEPEGLRVSSSDYGDDWPFTFSSGYLDCERQAAVVNSDGKTYGLNGVAKASGRYLPLEDVWRNNPNIPGLKVNIGPMIQRALTQCS
jgi:hypothetical protein